MDALHHSIYRRILIESLAGKYPGMDEAEIGASFMRIAIELARIDNPRDYLEQLVPLKSSKDDIRNQSILLLLIEHHWAELPTLPNPISTINSVSFGTPGNFLLRSTSSVMDYNEVIRVPCIEIPARLDELERLAAAGIASLKGAPITEKAFFLAYVHGSLIRIHPFSDGNGRTARFFVQYALRSWGLPPLPLPKVRNNAAWKSALSLATQGDYLPLQTFLAIRLSKSPLAQNYEKS